ncbi:GNAT family N-acetyltransferase [Marivita hallyeonensis]|uniref:Phosphinothricin acetyltransferase n=1 Tax=Marivita hallyeonensis TaxID=996342 RepID=A0A1M5RRG0_9RHOB|nr:GNAT family N-acetyltransferase [Marivita hallyeonensis]SHH28779.1 phosphinothricin acetyltransferase [Marivita hallyeonensis]
MIVRPARVSDAAAVTALVNDIVDNTTVTFTSVRKVEADIAADIASRGAAFQVVEIDGEVAGFATYFPFRAGVGYGHTKEHSIVLGPHARGRGCGSALMAALEDVARSDGVHSLIAGVSAENDVGRAFHAALGFVEVGVLPEVGRKFDRWLDLVLMQKIL